MKSLIEQLIDNNKAWAKSITEQNPDFFKESAKGQAPPILWIGCADSRVPANEIIGKGPGEVFVHRNVANMVVHTDMNMLTVLDYAVNVLKVKHVIVCGHYGCGGVLAAMSNKQFGLIDNWLRNIKDVYRLHQEELDAIKDDEERGRRYVELNVIEQVYDLGKTSIIQNSWRTRHAPTIHGWVYDLGTGLVNDLNVNISDNTNLAEVYQVDI